MGKCEFALNYSNQGPANSQIPMTGFRGTGDSQVNWILISAFLHAVYRLFAFMEIILVFGSSVPL